MAHLQYLSVILVLLVQVAAYAQIYTEQNRLIIGLLAGGFWLSRCLSGISVTRFPCTPTSSLVKTFGEHAGKRVGTALIVISLLSAVGCMGCYRLLGVAACAVAGLIFLVLCPHAEETVWRRNGRFGRIFSSIM